MVSWRLRGERVSRRKEVGNVCHMLVRDRVTWKQRGDHIFEEIFGDLNRKTHGGSPSLE